jgi:hypothetical protein
MKNILYIYWVGIILSCSSANTSAQGTSDSEYRIKKIKSKNSWYIIYAEKQDKQYKIVVGKDNEGGEKCQEIKVGKSYKLDLISRRDNAPEIGGVKLQPANHLDVQCFSYDEKTEVCIEPKKGIYDLYYTKDLKGLCYVR